MTHRPFSVEIPHNIEGLPQDEEYCILVQDGTKRRLRLHDYHKIYQIPGLYEYLFYDLLKCNSPEVVVSSLFKQVEASDSDQIINDLIVLELGAGNGIVGEALTNKGINSIVGIDIIEEAAQATERDRGNVYEDYFVEDLCALSELTEEKLRTTDFNCLVSVAALGFGDIPPVAFANAFNYVADDGWVAFNIKTQFYDSDESGEFGQFLRTIERDGLLDIQTIDKYHHRLALDGRPLDYFAVVGNKRGDIPQDLVNVYQPAKNTRSGLSA